MIGNIKDFELFAPIWRKIERYCRGEGISDASLLKTLSGVIEISEGMKVSAAINNWVFNHSTEEDRKNYVNSLCLSEKPEEKEEEEAVSDFKIC